MPFAPMSPRSPSQAMLARSLKVKRQRAVLDAIGARLGAPVVYLKAAWADPVLYGGRGERWGGDIDILVPAAAREPFARALADEGFRGDVMLEHHVQRGWQFRHDKQIGVDLHLGITEQPWFPLASSRLLKRAHAWDSADGPVMGLSAEDQVVHAAAHYAADRYTLDGRHLNDIVLLLGSREPDWDAIVDTCRQAHMAIPLHVLATMLRRRGAVVPDIALSVREKARLTVLRRVFNVGGKRRFFTPNRDANVRIDLLTFFPLLSTRWTALPRLLASAVKARIEPALPRGPRAWR